jgi:hypothetical protein
MGLWFRTGLSESRARHLGKCLYSRCYSAAASRKFTSLLFEKRCSRGDWGRRPTGKQWSLIRRRKASGEEGPGRERITSVWGFTGSGDAMSFSAESAPVPKTLKVMDKGRWMRGSPIAGCSIGSLRHSRIRPTSLHVISSWVLTPLSSIWTLGLANRRSVGRERGRIGHGVPGQHAGPCSAPWLTYGRY